MGKNVFLGLLILGAGLIVGWYVFGGNTPSVDRLTQGAVEQSPSPTPGSSIGNTDQSTGAGELMDKGGVVSSSVVTYTDTGFAPATITVSLGSAVTFVNESSRSMWVASAVHPTHQVLPGFDQKAMVARGGTYTYIFAKVGTWKYHNHQYPENVATVIVAQ